LLCLSARKARGSCITYFNFLPSKFTTDTWSSGKTLTQCSHLWPTVVWHRQIPVLNRAVYFNALQQRPPLMRETHVRIVECPSFCGSDHHSDRVLGYVVLLLLLHFLSLCLVPGMSLPYILLPSQSFYESFQGALGPMVRRSHF
jgi:hypothetical protein